MNKKSKIIILNGTSSSGKNSIAKELQKILDEPYLHIGIDNFLKMMPPKYIGFDDKAKKGFYYEIQKNQKGKKLYLTKAGVYGKKVVAGMVYACQALAKKGVNLIIDEVCYGSEQLQIYKNLFADYDLTLVGVKCPLNVVLEREKKNKVKFSTAEKELEIVHDGIDYDLEVNTGILSPEDCAKDIANFIFSQSNRSISSMRL